MSAHSSTRSGISSAYTVKSAFDNSLLTDPCAIFYPNFGGGKADTLSDEALRYGVKILRKGNKLLQSENDILQTYFEKCDISPFELERRCSTRSIRMFDTFSKISSLRSSTSLSSSFYGMSPHRLPSITSTTLQNRSQGINQQFVLKTTEKFSMAEKHLSEMRNRYEAYVTRRGTKRSNILREHECFSITINEIKESVERITEWHNSSKEGRGVTGEKLVAQMNDIANKWEHIWQGLRREVALYRTRLHRQLMVIKDREQLAQDVNKDDFAFITLQNTKLKQSEDEKYRRCMQLRNQTCLWGHKLNKCKVRVDANIDILHTLDKAKTRVQKTMAASKAEIKTTETKIRKMKEELKQLQYTVENYTAPSVMSYIAYTARTEELRKKVKAKSQLRLKETKEMLYKVALQTKLDSAESACVSRFKEVLKAHNEMSQVVASKHLQPPPVPTQKLPRCPQDRAYMYAPPIRLTSPVKQKDDLQLPRVESAKQSPLPTLFGTKTEFTTQMLDDLLKVSFS